MKRITIVALFAIVFLGAVAWLAAPGRPSSPPKEPYIEAEYHLGPCALWQGDLRRLDNSMPMMEGETLPFGDYYCEKPCHLDIEGLGVRLIHQYAVVSVERPAGGSLILASTAPPPRRERHNWQPGADDVWVCRVTCRAGFMALCEDGLCACIRAQPSPDLVRPRIVGNVEYRSSGSCGIRR